MKKRFFIIGLLVLVASVLAYCAIFLYERARVAIIVDDEASLDIRDSLSNATRMKVLILGDGTVARYVSEDENSFTADIQDTFTVPKEGTRVEVRSAADGQGFVFQKTPGMVQVLYRIRCQIQREYLMSRQRIASGSDCELPHLSIFFFFGLHLCYLVNFNIASHPSSIS